MKLAVALGGNLGDPAGTLRTAVADLAVIGDVLAVSSLYRSAPVGGPPQPAYLNAVAVVETTLGPEQALSMLHGIEERHGRTRSERWGPRTLDLDLIVTDGAPVDDAPHLVIPHPRAAERRFVMEPLAEVWPDAPFGTRTASALLAELADQDVATVAPAGWHHDAGRGGGWVATQLLVFGAAVAAALLNANSIGSGEWLIWLGRGLLAAGAAQMWLGLRALGRNLTPYPEPLEAGRLIETGIYRYVRHPLYGANVLLITGLAAHQQSWLGLAVAGLGMAFFWAKAGHEERRLVRRYAAYDRYRSSTRSRLIPWIL